MLKGDASELQEIIRGEIHLSVKELLVVSKESKYKSLDTMEVMGVRIF